MAQQDQAGGAPGFRANADDTPREGDDSPQTARQARPRFAAPAPQPARYYPDIGVALPPLDLPSRRAGHASSRPAPRRVVALAVTFAAFAVGIGVGLHWTRGGAVVPRQTSAAPRASPPVAEPAARPPARAAPPGPAPAPQARVAPRAERAPQLARRIEPPPPIERPARRPGPSASPARGGEAVSAAAEAARDASAVAPSASGPSGKCENAGTLAGQLGCDDPAVAEAHRQMADAYLKALDAGAPEAQLSADQARWLSSRQRAALTSPEALLSAYRQRIAQLRAWSRAPPGPSDEGRAPASP